MLLVEMDLQHLVRVVLEKKVPPIAPNDLCDEPHYTLYHTPSDFVLVGLDGSILAEGSDE